MTGECDCPIGRAVAVLEARWTLLVLRELFTGVRRFGELRATLAGVSPKTLTERLRFLEDRGVVRRVIYPEIPPKVEYSLTERGRSLAPVMEALRVWGEGLDAEP
jgi:DNA-binding HxlR family transcriptional regulator